MPSYWIRQAQQTHTSNPDTLKDREKRKQKEGKRNKKTKQENKIKQSKKIKEEWKKKKERRQITPKNMNNKGRSIRGRKFPEPEARWIRNEVVPPPRRRCDRQYICIPGSYLLD